MASIDSTSTRSLTPTASLTTESRAEEKGSPDFLDSRSGTTGTPTRRRLSSSSSLTSNKGLPSEHNVTAPQTQNEKDINMQAKSITNRRASNVDENQEPLKGFARFKERVRNFFNRLFRGSQWRMVLQKKRLLNLATKNFKIYDKHLDRLTHEELEKYKEIRGEFNKILIRYNDARINFAIKALDGKKITALDQLVMDTLPRREIDAIRLQITIAAGLFLFLYESPKVSQGNEEKSEAPPLLSEAGKEAGLQNPHRPLDLLETMQQNLNIEKITDKQD